MKLVLIAAVAQNGVIGADGTLPWHLPSDLQRFKALTLGKPVIMGRKTWDSLPYKPLPGRLNVVVSSTPAYAARAITAASLDEALRLVAEHDEAFVIGGAQLYRAALPHADRLEITRIFRDFDGDTVFPEIPPALSPYVATPVRYENGLPFRYETHTRT